MLFVKQLTERAAAADGRASAQEPKGPRQDPNALLRTAVQSKDPEVLFKIGELQGVLADSRDQPPESDPTGSSTHFEDTLAWWLVACERGLDCSENSSWHKSACTNQCPPRENGVEYIRRVAHESNFYDLELRAKDIREKLDANAWDELGL